MKQRSIVCITWLFLLVTKVLSKNALLPKLEFCVPTPTKSATHVSHNNYQTSKSIYFVKWFLGLLGEQLPLDDTHYLGWGRKVGFRSCESLGVEIDKVQYQQGKVLLGGILPLGSLQVTITINNKIISVVSEILPTELNDICYNGNNIKMLSIFPFSEVSGILKNKKHSSMTPKLISIPQAQSIDNPFSLYNVDKQTRHFVNLFTTEKSYVPLLAPILLAKISPSFISTTAQFSFGLNQFSMSIKPTGSRGSGAYEEIYRSSKSGIVSQIDFGTSITIFSNITFLVTPDRSGAYGRDFQKVKKKLVQSIIKLLLKTNIVLYDEINELACPYICKNFHVCDESSVNNGNIGYGSQQCIKDEHIKNPVNGQHIYFINETYLKHYDVEFKNVTVKSVVWKQSHPYGHLHVWSRRNCAPLCAAILNYNGTNNEVQKMSLRELFRFISLWQRFVTFPSEFLNSKIDTSPLCKAFGVGIEHAHPLAFKVMTQKKMPKTAIHHNNNDGSFNVAKTPEYDDGDDHDDYYTDISNSNTDDNNDDDNNADDNTRLEIDDKRKNTSNNDPKSMERNNAIYNGTVANENNEKNFKSNSSGNSSRTTTSNMNITLRKSKTYLITPQHLQPKYFEAMWETVTFSSTHCLYTYTPGVQTLDAILSSSLMAACIAWVLVLLSTWLVIGEIAVYLTGNHGYELPPIFEAVQIPFNVHLIYVVFPQEWFDRWTSSVRSMRRNGATTHEVDMSQMNTDFD
jgi:hypothetical protein